MYYQHNYLQEPVCKTPWKDTQPIFIKLSSEGFKFRQHWHRHTNKKIPLDERTRKKILRFLWTFKPNKSFCAYLVPSTIPNAPQKDHTNYTQFPKLGTRGKSGLKAPVTVQVTQGGGRTVWAHIGARRAQPQAFLSTMLRWNHRRKAALPKARPVLRASRNLCLVLLCQILLLLCSEPRFL